MNATTVEFADPLTTNRFTVKVYYYFLTTSFRHVFHFSITAVLQAYHLFITHIGIFYRVNTVATLCNAVYSRHQNIRISKLLIKTDLVFLNILYTDIIVLYNVVKLDSDSNVFCHRNKHIQTISRVADTCSIFKVFHNMYNS